MKSVKQRSSNVASPSNIVAVSFGAGATINMYAFICTMAPQGAADPEFAVTWARDDTVACAFDRTSASTLLDVTPGPTDNEDKPCDFAEEELPHWSFDLFLLAAQGEDTAKLHGLAALSARLLLTPSAEGSKSPPPCRTATCGLRSVVILATAALAATSCARCPCTRRWRRSSHR